MNRGIGGRIGGYGHHDVVANMQAAQKAAEAQQNAIGMPVHPAELRLEEAREELIRKASVHAEISEKAHRALALFDGEPKIREYMKLIYEIQEAS